ncbi:hypothetical protein [Parachitinimonas caeni]|uniref:Uncharacterized protein n=1 Tax=Parachitinimonas caeni TaxID=3031301 RepID=A0ABT7E1B7_9NEIS|nr:hypothetical protein [Parachitinimonas caeni]MDK2126044.1 hypothetical protein [Parachitinimonas caeni]
MVDAEQIVAASYAAQAAMNQYDAEILAELAQLYRNAVANLTAELQQAADGLNRVALPQLVSLRAQAEAELRRLVQLRDGLLTSGLQHAAELGSGPYLGSLERDVISRLNTQAVEFVRRFRAADGLQLSDRLWRVDRDAARKVGNAIELAIIRGDDAYRAAQMGLQIPTGALQAAQPASIGRAIGDALTGQGSAAVNMQRLFRTELNRAHGMAYQAGAAQTEGCLGTKFLLSPRHPHHDICDTHASADLYGLGKGVYPHGKNP